MKAKLPEREPEQLAAWEQMGLYDRILESRAGKPLFVLHDGPPYPTGEIHLGTGLNKTLKDMIVKSKTMAGFRAPYVPGWDCHGLPIETQVEKELGGKTSKVAPPEFRRMCREFAARYVEIHKIEFKRLGVFGQWDKPYLTMNPHDEACIAGAFLDFLEKGYVYRGLKPVYWCIYDRTALAEAEVEYEDHTSSSVWVKFPVVENEKSAKLGKGVSAPHLDDHSLDASGEPRARVPSGVRVRRRGDSRRQAPAGERPPESPGGGIRGRGQRNPRLVEGQGSRGHPVSASISGFARARRAWRLRHARPGQWHRSHRSRPRRRRFPHRPKIWHRTLRTASTTKAASSKACPNTRARPFSKRIPSSFNCSRRAGRSSPKASSSTAIRTAGDVTTR